MQEALTGKTLGHYQLRRLIGRGGMAEIYLAYDEHLGREVAVKIVHHTRTDELSRFQQEVGMLAQLVHEHILAVYDHGQDGPWHYLVLPYVSHGTLADRLRERGPLTVLEAGQLLNQVADALQYAHERGILHRDIKPSNILLRDDSYAYLADFGIAKLLERENGLTQTGAFVGTPEYMAPELFEESASQGSDIYALGIVLYMMLTGKLPFTGPNSLAVVEKQLHEPPLPPSQLNPAIPPAVEQTVLVALEKDPRLRFKSARDFKTAYNQALQNNPPLLTAQPGGVAAAGLYTDPTVAVQRTSLAAPLRSPAATSRPVRANRVLWSVIAGLLIVLLVLGGALLALVRQGNQASGQLSVSTTATATAAVSTPTATTRPATACSVNDAANILDQNQVCQQAQSLLSYSLIVNTSIPSGDGDASHLSQTPVVSSNTIVISIVVTQSHHKHNSQVQVTMSGGSAVPLTSEQYHRATEAFQQALQGNDYTSATIAAIQSLQSSGA
ncbi:MAG TPA: serine/threonine-protein kinase [Ktedonobacteraceae bacterium]